MQHTDRDASSSEVVVLDSSPTSSPSMQVEDVIVLDSPPSSHDQERSHTLDDHRRKRHRRDVNAENVLSTSITPLRRTSIIVIEDENGNTPITNATVGTNQQVNRDSTVPSNHANVAVANRTGVMSYNDTAAAFSDDVVVLNSPRTSTVPEATSQWSPFRISMPELLEPQAAPVLNNPSYNSGQPALPSSSLLARSAGLPQLHSSSFSIDLSGINSPRLPSSPTSLTPGSMPITPPPQVLSVDDSNHDDLSESPQSSIMPVATLSPLRQSLGTNRNNSHLPTTASTSQIEDMSNIENTAPVSNPEPNVSPQVRATMEILLAIENGDQETITPVLSSAGSGRAPLSVLPTDSFLEANTRVNGQPGHVSMSTLEAEFSNRYANEHTPAIPFSGLNNIRPHRSSYRHLRFASTRLNGDEVGRIARSRPGAPARPNMTSGTRRQGNPRIPLSENRFPEGMTSSTILLVGNRAPVDAGSSRFEGIIPDGTFTPNTVTTSTTALAMRGAASHDTPSGTNVLSQGRGHLRVNHTFRFLRHPRAHQIDIRGELPDYEELIRLDENLLRERNRANDNQIKSLPVKKASKEDEEVRCCICMCDVEEGEELRILPCNHKYHKSCIDGKFTSLCIIVIIIMSISVQLYLTCSVFVHVLPSDKFCRMVDL